VKLMKGTYDAMLNLSIRTSEKCNQMGRIEKTANCHINFDGQVNEQHKH